MKHKEQLWYLIEGVLNGAYDVQIFCDEFTRIYDLEIDYDELSQKEKTIYGELSEMAGRFSNTEEKLGGVNVYFNEKEILDKVKEVKDLLKNK